MYRVWKNSRQQGISFEKFESELIAICENQIDKEQVLSFAFLVYDEKNAEIIKMLYDSDYWKSLNEISGKQISIFSILHKEKKRVKANTSKTKELTMLTDVTSFENLKESNDKILSKFFEIETDLELPYILFFQVKEKMIVDFFIINLIEKNVEMVFNEIRDYISRGIETLAQIKNENLDNRKEIFQLLKQDLANLRTLKWFSSKSPVIKSLARLLGNLA